MTSKSGIITWLVLATTLAAQVKSQSPPAVSSPPASPAPSGATIDRVLRRAWQVADIQPAPRCNDAQFLRRVTLDIAGRIPTTDEIKTFLKHPDRAAKIDELLAADDFPKFFSEVWTAALNGYANAFDSDREVLRAWLEKSFRADVPYDKIVSHLISTSEGSAFDGAANFLLRYPRDPTVKVCRLFLGVRLDCARCHDHPFARWKQQDFTSMSRFFAATRRQQITQGNTRLANVLPDANSERPRFLTGAQPQTRQWRDELALFVVSCKPFARTFANRVWYHFMGRGIVHPIDDFQAQNPASVPALMTLLSEQVRKDGYALRPLIRRICNSQAYQLSAKSIGEAAKKRSLFALKSIKPLTPEQTYNAVVLALGREPNATDRERFIRRTVGTQLDEDFSHTWQYRETVQGLMGRLNLSLPATSPSIDDLFLRILSRRPSERDHQVCRGKSRQDVVFALVNSNEFFFNH